MPHTDMKSQKTNDALDALGRQWHEGEKMKDYITPLQASKMLDMHVNSLANLRSDGIGPRYYKDHKGRVLYDPKDIEDYLLSKEVNND